MEFLSERLELSGLGVSETEQGLLHTMCEGTTAVEDTLRRPPTCGNSALLRGQLVILYPKPLALNINPADLNP